MIIKPRVRGSLALNCHPIGCKKIIEDQIEVAKTGKQYKGAKKVLILGASSGYGLASRISLAFGGGKADTIGVSFEKEGTARKVGTAGWYNNIWFKEAAEKEGLIAKNFIGDAFSHEMRADVIKYIKEEFGGKIDLLIYSVASGVRQDPDTGILHRSSIKPIGEEFSGYTLNIQKEELEFMSVDPATEEEVKNTVKVMGGEDWAHWVKTLVAEDVCSEGFKSVAYSYIGGDITRAIYRDGTIGKAKEHLEGTAKELDTLVKEKLNGDVFTSVNRAITTKASAFIPCFSIYASVLFKVMAEQGKEESCMVHTHRLMSDMIYGDNPNFDDQGRMRPDSWELSQDIQDESIAIYNKITEENFKELCDFKLYKKYFMNLNGFEAEGINYDEDVDLEFLATLRP
ncbi:MAG: enoyl-[acyl-carrier-protein] reductase FabV [Fusobacteria bacterium]|nr:MAG: enoyl-[acyl-carrier-protein] reductase FabV [Fusobacteriota bacterium]